MRKKSIYMVAFCLLVSIQFVSTTLAADNLIVAPQTGANIKIDGDLGEWKLSLFGNDQKIVLTKDNGFINSGDIDDDEDFSAVIYALYDDADLYIAAEVTDDAIENSHPANGNWENDCIEMWIDGAGDDGTMTDTGGHDPDNYQFNVDVNGLPYIYRNDDAAILLALMETAAATQGTNYNLEVRIPFEAIPELDLNANRIMGLGISFVDSDDGVWNHILWAGQVENQPAEWGDLEFSLETLSVESVNKLSTTWGLMKSK